MPRGLRPCRRAPARPGHRALHRLASGGRLARSGGLTDRTVLLWLRASRPLPCWLVTLIAVPVTGISRRPPAAASCRAAGRLPGGWPVRRLAIGHLVQLRQRSFCACGRFPLPRRFPPPARSRLPGRAGHRSTRPGGVSRVGVAPGRVPLGGRRPEDLVPPDRHADDEHDQGQRSQPDRDIDQAQVARDRPCDQQADRDCHDRHDRGEPDH